MLYAAVLMVAIIIVPLFSLLVESWILRCVMF